MNGKLVEYFKYDDINTVDGYKQFVLSLNTLECSLIFVWRTYNVGSSNKVCNYMNEIGNLEITGIVRKNRLETFIKYFCKDFNAKGQVQVQVQFNSDLVDLHYPFYPDYKLKDVITSVEDFVASANLDLDNAN